MELKNRYVHNEGYQVYFNVVAPKELCIKLEEIISECMVDEGFYEKTYRTKKGD